MNRFGCGFGFLLFLGILNALQAQEPPLTLEDDQGNPYILITNSTGKPTLIEGSPLYQGRIRVGGDSFIIHQTLSSLEKHSLYRQWETKGYRSPWVSRALHLQLDGSTIEKFLTYFEAKPEIFRKALSGTTDEKALFLRSLLFSDEVILTEDDLKALRVSAFDPMPDPVEVRFPIEEIDSWIVRNTSEWFVQIAIKELSFKFRKKLIRLDPLQNLIRIRLECTGAVLKGPTLSVGRVDLLDLYQYPLPFRSWGKWARWLDEKREAYWKVENELLSGEVGPLSLELDLRFYRDKFGMWRIGLTDNLIFRTEGEQPKVRMTYRDEVPTRGGTTRTQDLGLHKKAQDIIAETLTKTLLAAFSSAILPEDLAFSVELQKNAENPVILQTRLADFRIGKQGIDVVFDARVLSAEVDACLPETPSRDLFVQNQRPLDRQPSYDSDILELERSAQTGGQWALTPSQEKGVTVRSSPGFVELVNHALYLSGQYCASTSQWKERAGSVPKINFRPFQRPELLLLDQGLEMKVEGPLELYSRDYSDRHEKFELIKTKSLQMRPTLNVVKPENLFRIEGADQIEFKDMSLDENIFIREVLSDVIVESREADIFSKGINAAVIAERMSEGRVSLRSLDISPQQIEMKVRLEDKFYESLFQPKEAARKSEAPLSLLDEGIPYVISDRFVTINWKSPTKAPFFSWRMREFPSGAWSRWTEFEEALSTTFPRPKPGKYEFQVKAMDLKFEIEKIPSSLQFLVPSEERIAGPISPDEGWSRQDPQPSPKEEPREQSATVQRAADRGAFGCQISAERVPRGPRHSILILGAFLLALGIVRRRVQRRAEDKVAPKTL